MDAFDPTRFDVAVQPGGYVWWYLDALSDDGEHGVTVIAFLGSVFSPYYAHARHARRRAGAATSADPLDHCTINVALYGRPSARWSMTERGRASVQRDATHLMIGPSALEWTPDGLRLRLDEVCAPLPKRIRGTIEVRLGARPSHHDVLDARGNHRWTIIAPFGRVAVALDAPRLAWSGSAYVDSNRGDAPLEEHFTDWDWSRAHLADGRAAVVYDLRRRGTGPLALAHWFDADGRTGTFDAPPLAALPRTLWGLDRSTRCEPGTTPTVALSLEDAPFYSRSVVRSALMNEAATLVHEHLSMDRFEQRWVRGLLPFRMPRSPIR